MINLPRESVTATEIVAWWTSMPIYFSWLITALLSVGGDTNNHNLQQSGRLLYCVHHRRCTQLATRLSSPTEMNQVRLRPFRAILPLMNAVNGAAMSSPAP